MIKGDENIDETQRDATLIEIKVKVAKMAVDIHWLKRILTAAAILACAALGVHLPEIFIQG